VVSLLGAVGLKWPYGVKSSLSIISTAMYNLGAASFGCWLAYDLRFYLTLLFPVLLGCCFLIVYAVFVWPVNRERWRRELHAAFSESDAEEHEPVEGHTPAADAKPSDPLLSSKHSETADLHGRVNAAPSSRSLVCRRLCTFDFFSKRSPQQVIILMKRSFVAFLVFYYPTVISEALAIFDCVLITDTYYVRSFVSIRCFQADWWHFLPWSISAFVFYGIGVPVLVLILLLRTRWGQDEQRVRDLFGESLLALKPKYRWWDLFSTLWRVGAVMVILLASSNDTRIGWLAGLIFGRAALTAFCKPSIATFENREDYALLACTLIVTLCALGFGVDQHMRAGLEAFLYVLAMAAVWSMVIIIGRATYRKVREEQSDGNPGLVGVNGAVSGGIDQGDGQVIDFEDDIQSSRTPPIDLDSSPMTR